MDSTPATPGLEPASAGARARSADAGLGRATAFLAPLARRLGEYGQQDAAGLVGRWREWAERPATIAVVGEIKRGKSTLVNALVGRAVSPTGVEVVTRGEIGIGPPTEGLPEGRARLVLDDGSFQEVTAAEAVAALRPLDEDTGEEGNRVGPTAVAAQVSAALRWLPGAALLDTPGVGGLVGEHAIRARAAAEKAGALLFVSDGGQVLTRPELDFLEEVSLRSEYVVFAVTKTDRTDGWQTVLEENRRLLAEHAPRFARAPIYPVAAVLAEAAWSEGPETAALLETASRVPELAAGLQTLTRGRRRLAVAKALRIGLTGLGAALAALEVEERAVDSEQVVQDLEAEQGRLVELSRRKSSMRVYIERDLGRARADAIASMNVLIDEALAEMTELAHSAKGRMGTEEVGEALRRRLQQVVDEVQGRFVGGIRVAVEDAFRGLEPEAEPAAAGNPDEGISTRKREGAGVAGTAVAVAAPGSEVALRTLSDLLPEVTTTTNLAGAVELGRVVRTRGVQKTSVLDPSMASYAFMGSHLGAVVGLGGPFAGPVLAAAWVGLNLVTRRGRESRQQLAIAVTDSFQVLRRDLPGVLDAVLRELRPELVLAVERTLDDRVRDLQGVITEARKAQQAEARRQQAARSRIRARRNAVTDLRTEAESLLEQMAPGGA